MVGYGFILALGVVIAVASAMLLRGVAANKDQIIYDDAQELIVAERLRVTVEQRIAAFRGYLLYRDETLLQDMPRLEKQIEAQTESLQKLITRPIEQRLLAHIKESEKDYQDESNRIIQRVRSGENMPQVLPEMESRLRPIRRFFEDGLKTFVGIVEQDVDIAKSDSAKITSRSLLLIYVVGVIALLMTAFLAWLFTGRLSEQYGKALLATRRREEVLGTVAHDLRNPLAAIQMNAALLRLSGTDSIKSKVLGLAEKIDRATVTMNRLITDLLDFEKIEAGRMSLKIKKESVSELLLGIIESMRPAAESASVRLVGQPPNSSVTVRCDRDRIYQVLGNLVGNSIKFTPSGGLITVGSMLSGSEVRFFVQDTGPGIPTDQIPRLFERYWQAKETAQKGHGLGLNIARSIIEAHGGKIWAESKVGNGSVFWFTLPSPVASNDLAESLI